MKTYQTNSISDRTNEAVTPDWRWWHLAGVTALTVYSTAIAWQAQLVSYPLYRAVGGAEFADYHQAYNQAIPLVVIAPGFISFAACAAYPWTRPAGTSRGLAWVVAASGVGSILSTVLWAIPRHDRLDRIGQDAATIASLLQANALRTGLLTAGALALVVTLGRALTRR